jgi:hypothetical protein
MCLQTPLKNRGFPLAGWRIGARPSLFRVQVGPYPAERQARAAADQRMRTLNITPMQTVRERTLLRRVARLGICGGILLPPIHDH